MLLELFCAHREFRRDIISMCHNRLIGAKVGWQLGRWLETWGLPCTAERTVLLGDSSPSVQWFLSADAAG